jgi:hypothetical protein
MRRWSKLQKEIEQLFVEEVDLRIQCRAYRMASQRRRTDLPRYWVTLGKDVIWDYPRDFGKLTKDYPYLTDSAQFQTLSEITLTHRWSGSYQSRSTTNGI